MIKVLIISPDFNYACGVSMHVYLLLKELSQRKELNIFFITNKGDSLDRLRELKVRTDFIEFKLGNKNPFVLIKNLMLLHKYCRKNKIDIIHSHHRYPELLSFMISKFYKIKTVSTVHSLVEGWKYLSFKSHKIIVVSRTVENLLINQYKVRKQKILQLYNYVRKFAKPDEETLNKMKVQLGIEGQDRILLFVGRINYVKGFDVLAAVFRKLVVENPNIKLLVVGEYETEVYGQMVEGKNIFYVKPKKYVYEYFILSDIVLLPSRIEPLGYVMLESGLAKKPFIGGRTGGIEEFIEDGVDGLLVEPGNAEDLHNKIIYLLNDSDLQKTLGENLYNKVLPLTNKDAYIQKLISIYEELLQSRN